MKNQITSAQVISKAVVLGAAFCVLASCSAYALTASDLQSSSNMYKPTVNGDVTTLKLKGGEGSFAQANWKQFDIPRNKTVDVKFTANNQTLLNKVTGTKVSEIYGQLTNSSSSAKVDYAATGKVILINPNGITFGMNSSVNLNSFTASTLNGVYDKNTRKLTFSGSSKKDAEILLYNNSTVNGVKALALVTDKNITTAANSNLESPNGKVLLAVGTEGSYITYNAKGAISKYNVKTSGTKANMLLQGGIQGKYIDIKNKSNGDITVTKNLTAKTPDTAATAESAYKIAIDANGNIYLTNATIESTQGDINITSSKKVEINNSTVKANNFNTIYAKDGIKLTKSNIQAKHLVVMQTNGKLTRDKKTKIGASSAIAQEQPNVSAKTVENVVNKYKQANNVK